MKYNFYRRRLEEAINRFSFHEHNLELVDEKLVRVPCKRPIISVEDLLDAFEKRAKSETELRNLSWSMLRLLEPPVCWKEHCDQWDRFSYCNCMLGKIPGLCKENREYLKRKCEREERKNEEGG